MYIPLVLRSDDDKPVSEEFIREATPEIAEAFKAKWIHIQPNARERFAKDFPEAFALTGCSIEDPYEVAPKGFFDD